MAKIRFAILKSSISMSSSCGAVLPEKEDLAVRQLLLSALE